ncbi:hypothetical protein DRB87_15630 [Pandoraea sp. XY-2]|nr:hypothetical protein DRB87_15630 [Pandoraea sp. XY-2]
MCALRRPMFKSARRGHGGAPGRLLEQAIMGKRWALATLAVVSVLLAGCASTVTSQVTAFGDAPGFDGPRTYALVRTPEQQNNQEHATYEQWLRTRLAGDGFSERSSSSAHYLVGMSYGITQQIMRVAEPVYDPMFGPGPWGLGGLGDVRGAVTATRSARRPRTSSGIIRMDWRVCSCASRTVRAARRSTECRPIPVTQARRWPPPCHT